MSWPATERLLNTVGVQQGWKCLDAGCGTGSVAIKIAGMVGLSGSVVGEDFNAAALEAAREEARASRSNVEFRQSAISDLEDREDYELVYARLLLSWPLSPAVDFLI